MSFDELHVDDDVLALLALGEQVASPADLAHLEACERCADELMTLREVVALARAAGSDSPLVVPAPVVWQRVADELELSPSARAHGESGPTDASSPSLAAPTSAEVVPLTPRRSRRMSWPWLAGAAAVGLVVGGIGVRWWSDRAEPVTVLATATLEPLPGWDTSGSAVLETAPDGSRVLVVDLASSVPSHDAFQEVWLLTPDVKGLVSLGTLDGSSGRFDVPADLNLSEYSVVDVSQERIDGNPAHSGDSIVRGALRA